MSARSKVVDQTRATRTFAVTLLRDQASGARVLDRVVAGPSRDDEHVVVLGEVLAELGQQLTRRRRIGVEVLVQDEDAHVGGRASFGRVPFASGISSGNMRGGASEDLESAMSQPLEERAVAGLHRFVIERVLVEHAPVPAAAVDLGAGSGALASRLRSLGWDVVAVERDVDDFRADVPVVRWDLDATDLPPELDGRRFDLDVATEFIEHMESPIAFLRKVRALLDDHGVAILTTPNVDSALARLKFLASDRLRMMDAAGDPTTSRRSSGSLFVSTSRVPISRSSRATPSRPAASR